MSAGCLIGTDWPDVPTSVIPALSRYPASPGPWAEKTLLAAQTRVGWIPAQGRNDGEVERLYGIKTAAPYRCSAAKT
ncbi:MAG: hypothetical protein ACT6RN_09190 [Agrobacterium sp.]|uniref:hypothetical protein n=1 Tax=Agrobacterium sp. TaxID=361 RepID=UPI004037F925